MKKVEKVKTTFTMDKKLSDEFDKHIEDKLLSRSKVIEFLIKEYMNNI
jgi:metal-responsive CopG/Arc/MetJ family transcriptional regulator